MKRLMRQTVTVVMAGMMMMACGCAHMGSSGAAQDGAGVSADNEPTPLYLDFGDVLIPTDMKINPKTSFVLRTAGVTAGVLSLRGRVEPASLVTFFDVNMAKDNWQLVSSFKAPRTLMLYRKDTRWCVINVYEGDFYTHVEIWVSPTLDGIDSGLMK